MNVSGGSIYAPVITFSRLRMTTDGKGITTLVGFYGCPLRCKYCLNPFSFSEDTKRENITPLELYERVKKDQLYFLATGGGVTFGGGEPLLYPDFLAEFRKVCGDEWNLCVETSLNVSEKNIRVVAECIDVFYVDCKDVNDDIYKKYTSVSNVPMIENLKLLLALVGNDRIVVRVPLIKNYNTNEDRNKSISFLSSIGIKNFDVFEYRTPE